MNLSIDLLSASAMLVFVIGVVGLFACTLATQQSSRRRSFRWGTRRPGAPPPRALSSPAVPAALPRRAVTGMPARERLAAEVVPPRQGTISPDVFRRERARQRSDDDREFVLQMLNSDPELIADAIGRWLADDEAEAAAHAAANDPENRRRW